MPVTDVRRVCVDDWPRLRAMRLEALQDEMAPIAYLETYQEALARPDTFWQERAAGAAAGDAVAQLVAITDSGEWVGSATGLREDAGATDWAGHPIEHQQVHVVGVWVHAEYRGVGILSELVDRIESWATESGVLPATRSRLLVHEDNARAQAAYRKIGFVPTGVTVPLDAGIEIEMTRSLG